MAKTPGNEISIAINLTAKNGGNPPISSADDAQAETFSLAVPWRPLSRLGRAGRDGFAAGGFEPIT
jgi:hypothetical protein